MLIGMHKGARGSTQIAVRLPAKQLAELDEAIARGRFESRAEALRAGLEMLLSSLRELQIAEEYRGAYEAEPQEAAFGEAGARLAGEAVREERRRAG